MSDALSNSWSSSRISFTVRGAEDQSITVDRPYALLGSGTNCDVVLNSKRIPRRAMLFIATGRGLRALMLSSGSKRAGQRVRIEPDHPIRMGDFEIVAQVDSATHEAPVEQPSDEATIWLATWQSRDERHFLRLKSESPILVGRKAPAHVEINDERMSGQHCVLFRVGDKLWVIDLNSANGTWVASEPVRCAPLEPGQSLRAGTQRVHFLRLHTDAGVESIEKQSHESVRQYRDDLQSANIREATAREMLARANAEQRSTSSSLEQSRAYAQRLEAEARDLRSELSGLSDQLGTVRDERDELQRQLLASQALLTDAKAAHSVAQEALQARADSLEKELLEAKALLNDNEALRQRELQVEALQRDLALERQILHELHLGVQPQTQGDSSEATTDDETCISTFDFQDTLEQALEGLPSLDDE